LKRFGAIIADDEASIREGLVGLTDWESHGFRILGLACDGLEAFDLWQKTKAELLITDMRMPGLSGPELMRKIRELDRNTRFIVISGYKDFGFAKAAIEYNVQSYLLKPIDAKEMAIALQKVFQALNQNHPSVFEDDDIQWRLDWSNGTLFNALENGGRTESSREIQRLFSLLRNNHASFLFVQSIVGDILGYLSAKGETIGYDMRRSCMEYISRYFTSGMAHDLGNMQTELNLLCEAFCAAICDARQAAKSVIRIKEITDYLHKNYSSKINLRSVAASFYVNPIYLGQVFRKKTGSYFNEYLNKLRIEKAIELMEKTSMSLSEIASATGYSNQVSFYRVFKELLNSNPADFRNKHYGGDKNEIH